MTTSMNAAQISMPAELSSVSTPSNASAYNQSGKPYAKGSEDKLDFIDAMRGVACLCVLFYHVNGLFLRANIDLPPSLDPIVRFTYYGVPLFFVISAFTLYLSLEKKSKESKKFIKFYIRRLFRIAPLFYAVVAIYLLRDIITWSKLPSGLEILENVLFVFNFSPSFYQSIVMCGWTIGVEMLFYLCLPLVFVAVKSLRSSLAFFVVALTISKLPVTLLPETFSGQFNNMSFSHNLPIFAIGIACYFAYKHYIPKVPRQFRAITSALLFISSSVIFYALISWKISAIDGALPATIRPSLGCWQGFAFSLLLLSLALFPTRLIVNRWTRFYGKISYSLYLVYPVLLIPLVPTFVYICHSSLPIMISFGICLILSLLVSTPAAMFTYRFVESPGMKYGREVIARI
jgi:peptidoglycan/LPS O-acetylase OafA/YrhL